MLTFDIILQSCVNLALPLHNQRSIEVSFSTEVHFCLQTMIGSAAVPYSL
jgi:hypothetical protein